MQFLKTVFWALVAAVVALFAWVNWNPVTLNLWANLQADIKIPVLLLAFFLLGFLPTYFIMRARLWTMKRRLEPLERQHAAAAAAPARQPVEDEGGPVI